MFSQLVNKFKFWGGKSIKKVSPIYQKKRSSFKDRAAAKSEELRLKAENHGKNSKMSGGNKKRGSKKKMIKQKKTNKTKRRK